MDFKKKVVAISVMALIFMTVIGLGVLKASSAPPESPHYSYSECTSCHSDRIDYHSTAISHPESECIACHGDRTDEVSQYDAAHSQYYDGPHKVHLTSAQLSFNCTQCHLSVDLREKSAGSVRRQVSMICAECHSPFSVKMRPEWASQDCTGCHSDWASRHTSKSYINNAGIGPSDCIGCHGGRSWYLSGAAAMKLEKKATYWASPADYSARRLSVDFRVTNNGPGGAANDTSLTSVVNTNEVTVASTLPASLGTVPQGSSQDFTLVYNIPQGVGSYLTNLYAQAVNDDDETQYWPSPPSP